MADFILDPGEEIVERIGRYWVDLVPPFLAGAAIVIVVIFGLFLYANFGSQFPLLTPGIVFSLAALMLTIVFLIAVSAVYVFSRNYLLVTNKHLIKIQQSGLFARHTAELGLANIEDVKGSRHGIFGTLLDFGDLEIQTAAASENFIFRTAHHPQLAADRLLQYKEEFRRHHPM